MTKAQLMTSFMQMTIDLDALLSWYEKRMGNEFFDQEGGDEIWMEVRSHYKEAKKGDA